MGAVDGVGKGPSEETRRKLKAQAGGAAFQAAAPKAVAPAPAVAKPPAPPPVSKKTGGFQVANPEPIRQSAAPAQAISPAMTAFAQGMVQAADAAAMPGPTTESDLLPRESVSGLFIRDFALQGAVALGRAPLGEDEAARIVIEKHIAGTPGLYYDAAVEASGPDAYLVRLHRLDTNPPFLPEANAEATYKIDRRTWQIDEQR